MVRIILTSPYLSKQRLTYLKGKNWHEKRQAFRPTAALTPYAKRKVAQDSLAATKAREKEMKAEKKEAKDELVRRIKEKREKKAERERYEKMEEKMHKKRVERVKRREKRNKMLKS